METEEVAIDQIDQPVNVLNRAKTFSSLGRDVPGSKTFRRWVAEHGEEIDECMKVNFNNNYLILSSSDNYCGTFGRG